MARRSDHSREQLADMAVAAATALAERDGLRGVTARGVAREIGYTVGTLYNVFDNLDDVLRHATGLPVSIAEEPLTCVALGTGRTLEEMGTLKHVLNTAY